MKITLPEHIVTIADDARLLAERAIGDNGYDVRAYRTNPDDPHDHDSIPIDDDVATQWLLARKGWEQTPEHERVSSHWSLEDDFIVDVEYRCQWRNCTRTATHWEQAPGSGRGRRRNFCDDHGIEIERGDL